LPDFFSIIIKIKSFKMASTPKKKLRLDGSESVNSASASLDSMAANKSDGGQQYEDGGSVNPLTRQPYTQRYFDILSKRRLLPVHQQRAEFLDLVHRNQIVLLVGETGSGKTTQ
jgi:pre-mRNA-splicing factor ATP-dependent RNA helicase DHX15/PRP43